MTINPLEIFKSINVIVIVEAGSMIIYIILPIISVVRLLEPNWHNFNWHKVVASLFLKKKKREYPLIWPMEEELSFPDTFLFVYLR